MSIYRAWLVRSGLFMSALFLSMVSCFAQEPAGVRRVGTLAHIASGGGWVTTITLINLSTASVTARIQFYDDNGSPLTLPLDYPQLGLSVFRSSEDLTIAANGSVVIETGVAVPRTLVGWADVQARGAVTGYAIFRFNSPAGALSEGTVPLDTAESLSMALPYDNTRGFQTGLALVNQSSTDSIFIATLYNDAGSELASFRGGLSALGHGSFFVHEMFPASSNRRGIIRLQSEGAFTALGLRFNPSGSFTSVPIVRPPSR